MKAENILPTIKGILSNIKSKIKSAAGHISAVTPNRTLWFWLFVISLMSVYDIMYYNFIYDSSWLFIIGEVIFAFFKATVLTWLYALLRNKKVFRVIFILFFIFYTFFSTINFFSTALYSRPISRSFFIILLETDSQETSEFLPVMIGNLLAMITSAKSIVTIIILAAVYLGFRYIPLKALRRAALIGSSLGVLFTIYIFSMFGYGRVTQFMIVRAPVYARIAYNEYQTMVNAYKYIKPLPDPETAVTRALAENIVVVIGESSSRSHNSMYGYPIDTNPYTRAMGDSLYIFTDAIGSSISTADNMTRILTFMPDDIYGNWYDYPSIIQLYNQLGYTTSWFSNQERTSNAANSSTCIAHVADREEYVGIQSYNDWQTFYDENLMPPYREALADDSRRRLILLHLKGSHTQYDIRIPRDRHIITAEEELRHSPGKWLNRAKAQMRADYDNTILYTDSLLCKMIEPLSASPKPSILVYFSDHGEHVYDNRDYVGRDETTVDVPMWVYLNKAYTDANPEMAQRLRRATSRRFTTANVIYLIMALSGSDYSWYDPGFDVMSDGYDTRHIRYVDEAPWKPDIK